MRKIEYTIALKPKEIKELKKIIKAGTQKSRTITRARILLLAHQKKSNLFIHEALNNISPGTIVTIKKRYREGGLDNALYEKPRPGKPSLISGNVKAKITALACTKSPAGYGQWSLRLLADKIVELKYVKEISHTTVHTILKKTT